MTKAVKRFDTEIPGGVLDFLGAHPAEGLFGAAKVKKELALRLGRSDLDDAPVLENEFVNLGLDPMDGEGNEAHTHIRVETLHGFHQADITFLDEVAMGESITFVTTGDADHEAQMREDEFTRSVQIAVLAVSASEVLFLLEREERNSLDRVDIGFERACR